MVICKRYLSLITIINRLENSGSKKIFEHDHEPTTDHYRPFEDRGGKTKKNSAPDPNQVHKVKVDYDSTN